MWANLKSLAGSTIGFADVGSQLCKAMLRVDKILEYKSECQVNVLW